MELPKIKNEDLPKELREILGDEDAEFDAIVDPMDVISIQIDQDAYYEERAKDCKDVSGVKEKDSGVSENSNGWKTVTDKSV